MKLSNLIIFILLFAFTAAFGQAKQDTAKAVAPVSSMDTNYTFLPVNKTSFVLADKRTKQQIAFVEMAENPQIFYIKFKRWPFERFFQNKTKEEQQAIVQSINAELSNNQVMVSLQLYKIVVEVNPLFDVGQTLLSLILKVDAIQ